jgi:hypothetical protein
MYYGQGLDICWRENYTCPSVEEYKQMAIRSKYSTVPLVGFNCTCELVHFVP